MKLLEVQSSTISKIGYDYSKAELHIHFNHGGEYIYRTVPVEVYSKFLEADSKGKYFHANIVGKYDYRRIN